MRVGRKGMPRIQQEPVAGLATAVVCISGSTQHPKTDEKVAPPRAASQVQVSVQEGYLSVEASFMPSHGTLYEIRSEVSGNI